MSLKPSLSSQTPLDLVIGAFHRRVIPSKKQSHHTLPLTVVYSRQASILEHRSDMLKTWVPRFICLQDVTGHKAIDGVRDIA
jgi:hypothetical protein